MQTRREFISMIIAGAFALPSAIAIAGRMVDFEQVHWLIQDESEPYFGARIRYCDLCDKAFCHDLWEGREIRAFYRDRREGLCVCEHCLPGYLHEVEGAE